MIHQLIFRNISYVLFVILVLFQVGCGEDSDSSAGITPEPDTPFNVVSQSPIENTNPMASGLVIEAIFNKKVDINSFIDTDVDTLGMIDSNGYTDGRDVGGVFEVNAFTTTTLKTLLAGDFVVAKDIIGGFGPPITITSMDVLEIGGIITYRLKDSAGTVHLTFTKNNIPNLINPSQQDVFQLIDVASGATIPGEVSVQETKVTFTPSIDLETATTYEVKLDKIIFPFLDQGFQTLESETTWGFTTQ